MAWTSVVFPVPSSPDSPMTAGALSWAPSSSPNRLSSLAERRIGLELQELIAEHRRQLEIELLSGGLHLLLQHADQGLALAGVGWAADLPGTRLPNPRVGHAGHETDIEHRLHDGPRRDAVLDVVRDLCLATSIHLFQRPFHRAGDAIGVQNGSAAEVARRAPHGLDQRPIRSEEALLVGVQHRDEGNLGEVQPFAQQVDSHQDVELAETQAPNDLHALDRIDLRM